MSVVADLQVHVQGPDGQYHSLHREPQVAAGALIPAVGDLLRVQRRDGRLVHLKVVKRLFFWPEPGSVTHRESPGLPVVELFCRETYGPHPLGDDEDSGITRLEQFR